MYYSVGSSQAADTYDEFGSILRYRKMGLLSFSNIVDDPMSISEVI